PRTHRPPIGFFEPLPFGLMCFLAGTAYLLVFGPKVLPVRRNVTSAESRELLTEYVTEVSVLPGSPLAGRTVLEAIGHPHPELSVIEVVRGGEILGPNVAGLRLAVGDVVLLRGRAEAVAHLKQSESPELLPELAGR